jgi:hypothetical protein
MTTFRIKDLESLDFEWDIKGAAVAWEDRLSELADYRKIHGHCNVPRSTKLGKRVTNQRTNYRLYVEGKKSPMTSFRIKDLESLDFEWGVCVAAWEGRLSELADYRKIHGHSNVPYNYGENVKLAKWVAYQRSQYRWHVEGKTSPITDFRIQKLESLGFEWDCHGATWEGRLSELADYRKIHGHCNVPSKYSENTKLATWVGNQRCQYRLHLEGKTSPITDFRIQKLESLGFEWKPSIGRGKGNPKKPNLDNDTTRVRERAVEAPEHVQTTSQTQEDFSSREIHKNQVDVASELQRKH